MTILLTYSMVMIFLYWKAGPTFFVRSGFWGVAACRKEMPPPLSPGVV